jgi:hypothetical protein
MLKLSLIALFVLSLATLSLAASAIPLDLAAASAAVPQ